jgi:hypothetical protein
VVLVYSLDFLWLLLTILAVPIAIHIVRTRDFSWAVIASAVLVGAGIVARAFHPSPQGAALVTRWVGVAAVVVVASRLDRAAFRLHVAIPLIGTAVIQTLFVLWQLPGPGRHGANTVGVPWRSGPRPIHT